MWVIFGIALVILTVAVGGWALVHWMEARRVRPAKLSSVAAEMAAMRAAWRVRDAEQAAERHMDEFIAKRQAEQRGDDPNVVDGEVIEVRTEPPTWPSW